ncbi:MAG: sulfurtransferase TusA family protein [Candidatus Firestonebacteria bacterium]|nr:sulfurtransferase TusA family protein [Candidatus Firestonebacteria bacterium]
MEDKSISACVDLTHDVCPITFVKSKLKLEELNKGDILEIKLKKGSAVENVPRSLKMEGHKIIKITQEDDIYTLLVEKGE